MKVRLLVILIALLGLLGCAPRPPARSPEALRPLSPERIEPLGDDLDQASLEKAIQRSLTYLRGLAGKRKHGLGREAVTTEGLIQSLEAAQNLLWRHGLTPAFFQALQKDFSFYGSDDETLFTGYYEPLLEGRLQPGDGFDYPIYTRPDDLVSLNLKDFGLEARTIQGQVKGSRVIPYPARAEIDQGALSDKGLEIAWVDPVEAFFLHIQGSGRIRFADGGEIRVNYAAQNGRPYVALGQVLIQRGLMTKEEVSLPALKKYLRDHPDQMAELMASNPSYVFFRVVGSEGPLGCYDFPLTAGRSLAVDKQVYPPAGLALIQTQKPVIEDGRITGWRPFSRLVLMQDTGGALKGPARADIFFGAGPEAELAAGHLKHPGRLYFLALRSQITP